MISTQQNNPELDWRCEYCYKDEDDCECFCSCGTKLISDEEKDTKVCRDCK